MKKLLIALLVAVFALPTFNSCKKGENDPGISLNSRKSRLVGEWKLTAGTAVENDASTIYNYSYNGSTCVVSGSGNASWSYTESMSIKKDGTFILTIFDDGDQSVLEGNWYFLGANKDEDIKDKEAVDFVYTKWTQTPSGGTPSVVTFTGFFNGNMPYNGFGFTWLLDQLKSKEIIVKHKSSITGTSTYTYDGTMTYSQ